VDPHGIYEGNIPGKPVFDLSKSKFFKPWKSQHIPACCPTIEHIDGSKRETFVSPKFGGTTDEDNQSKYRFCPIILTRKYMHAATTRRS
jgi:hypothetical protein